MPQILGWIFVATALCLSTTGCRFGNHVETAVSSMTYQGYYSTAPTEAEFCTNAPGGCQSVPVGSLPALVTTALTDPVAVLVSNRQTGEGHLVASDGTGYALPSHPGRSLLARPGLHHPGPDCRSRTSHPAKRARQVTDRPPAHGPRVAHLPLPSSHRRRLRRHHAGCPRLSSGRLSLRREHDRSQRRDAD